MIPYQDLCAALDRYRRRRAGLAVDEAVATQGWTAAPAPAEAAVVEELARDGMPGGEPPPAEVYAAGDDDDVHPLSSSMVIDASQLVIEPERPPRPATDEPTAEIQADEILD